MSRWSLVQRTDYANLFGDEGGERSSLARGGRKNWWDGFSTAIRKFLKHVGVHSQREIEAAVR